jgi:hypothetical protein
MSYKFNTSPLQSFIAKHDYSFATYTENVYCLLDNALRILFKHSYESSRSWFAWRFQNDLDFDFDFDSDLILTSALFSILIWTRTLTLKFQTPNFNQNFDVR